MNIKLLSIGLLVASSATFGFTADTLPESNISNAVEKAVAEKVNENFQELAKRIGNRFTVKYNFLDRIRTDVSGSKVFTYTFNSRSSSIRVTETRTKTIIPQDDGTRLMTTLIVYKDESQNIINQSLMTAILNDDGMFVKSIIRDYGGDRERTDTFSPPLVYGTSSMEIGKNWGTTSSALRDPSEEKGYAYILGTLLGIEDVTVPAGTFLNCTKILRNHSGLGMGVDSVVILWHCKDVGLVKRIQFRETEETGVFMELSSYD